jgi:hypothetical protein
MPDLALRTHDGATPTHDGAMHNHDETPGRPVATWQTRLSALARTGRPLLLDLAGRSDLVEAAAAWRDRVQIISASTVGSRPADAVLIRPDGHVAWATAARDQSAVARDQSAVARDQSAVAGLRQALTTWFGAVVAV